MQDLLSQLSPPIAITLIVAGVLALIGVVLLARRRRRQSPSDDGGTPGLGGPIDYTSIPLDEEPQNFRDRFNNLPLAGKILTILVPVLGLLGLIVLLLALLPGQAPVAGGPLPTVEPIGLSFLNEPALASTQPSQRLNVSLRTSGLSNNTELIVELLEDGEPFAWVDPQLNNLIVRNGRAEGLIPRAASAPRPTQGRRYQVRVSNSDGAVVEDANLVIPPIYAAEFYSGGVVAVRPSATAAPSPTAAPGVTPAATAAPSATAAPALPTGLESSVRNGGNVRSLPFIGAENVIGGVDAGDPIQLIQRTPNGEWYRVRFTSNVDATERVGWASTSLLVIPGGADQVPVAPIVTVFANGPVYEGPDPTSTQVDRVNATADPRASEVVELLRRTADSAWYEVVNVRGITGWVPANLLGVPEDVASRVAVADNPTEEPTEAATAEATAETTATPQP